MRWLVLACLSVGLAACGGEPVGSKIPQADPAAVAVGAAAAAGAASLAAPDKAGKKPETDSADDLRGKKTTGETVPAGVLDRVDAKPDAGTGDVDDDDEDVKDEDEDVDDEDRDVDDEEDDD